MPMDTTTNYGLAKPAYQDKGSAKLDEFNTAQDSADASIKLEITTHTSDTSNPHSVTKTQVGLGNVVNYEQVRKDIGTAKGDLIVYTASGTPVRLGVGADGKVLTADSNQTEGMGWADSGEGASAAFSALTGAPTDNTALSTALGAKESTANKGAANGYAPLDSGSKVPTANLPSGLPSAWPAVITVGDTGYGSNTNDLSGALTNIGESTQCTLVVPKGSTCVGNNLTITSNIHLRVERGGIITLATGTTLTINGTVEAGPYQIFSRTGTGTVAFGANNKTGSASLEWFGCKGDGSTNDTTAMQWAVDAIYRSTDCNVHLVGRPKATYVASNVTINPSGWNNDLNSVLNFNGATIKAASISDTFMLKVTGNFAGEGRIENVNFLGWIGIWVSADTVAAVGSGISIGGNTATAVGNIQALDNPSFGQYKYYYDAGAQTLYISFSDATAYADSLPGGAEGSLTDDSDVTANGVAVQNWSRYQPTTGLFCKAPSFMKVRNAMFSYCNIGLEASGVQFSEFSSLFFQYCDQAIKLERLGGDSANIQSTFRDIKAMWIWNYNSTAGFSLSETMTCLFDGVLVNAIRGRILETDGACQTLGFRGWSTEGCAYYCAPTATVEFSINSAVVHFFDSGLQMGIGGSFSSTYETLFDFGSYADVITVDNCYLHTGGSGNSADTLLYRANTAARALVFRNNVIDVPKYTDGDAIVRMEDNSYPTDNSHVYMNIEMLESAPSFIVDHSNYHTFTSAPSTTLTGATVTMDTGAGGYVVSSGVGGGGLKVTFSASPNNAMVNSAMTGATGNTYWLCSAFYKSDDPLYFVLGNEGGPSSGYIYAPGDEKWRIVYWFGVNTNGAYSYAMDIIGYGVNVDGSVDTDAYPTGHLWIDGISLKCFDSKSERTAFIGKYN